MHTHTYMLKEKVKVHSESGRNGQSQVSWLTFCLLAIESCLTHFFPNFSLKIYPFLLGLYDYKGADFISPSFLGDGGLATKSCPDLATTWTIACQATLSVGFSRQEY